MTDLERTGVRHSRSRLQAVARVQIPGFLWQADVIDLSPSGALLRRPDGMDLEEGCQVSIELSCNDAVATRVQGRTVRVDAQAVAFVFEALGPTQEQDIRELIQRRGSLKDGVS
jgi:hypothetical protein